MQEYKIVQQQGDRTSFERAVSDARLEGYDYHGSTIIVRSGAHTTYYQAFKQPSPEDVVFSSDSPEPEKPKESAVPKGRGTKKK